MSIRDEAHLFDIIKTMVPGHWCRVENYAGVGFPDVNYAIKKGKLTAEGWTELKILHSKYNEDKPLVLHNIRPFQYAFWMRRSKVFGNISVTIGTKEGEIIVVPPHLFSALFRGQRPMGDYPRPIQRGRRGADDLFRAYADPYAL